MADNEVYGSGTQGWDPAAQPAGYPPAGQPAQPAQGYPPPAQPAQPSQPQYAQGAPYNQQGPYPPQGPYTPPAAYGQQGYYGQAAPARTPAIAIVGLILAFIMAPVGLVVSIIAIGKAKRAGAGRGLAVAGTVVGAVLTLLGVILIPLLINKVGEAVSGPRVAFTTMQSSLQDSDCDAFLATTTPRFQEQLGIGSCDDFDAMTQAVAGGPVPFGNVPVTGVEVSGDTGTVTTLERVPTADGTDTTLENFEYTVIRQDGTWLVDYVAYAD